MAPLVRRTWAPRGSGPTLFHKGRHREKVSVAAALWLTPNRDRVELFTQTLVNGYFNNQRIAPFLTALSNEIDEPLVVVWDGGGPHKGDPIRALERSRRGEVWLEQLPAYGSELMPVEQLWTWLKYDRLANFAPHDALELDAAVNVELERAGRDQERLRNFFHASRLPLPRALLI